MAITKGDCLVWRTLRRMGLDTISSRPKVLEIGKANWYGDVKGDEFSKDWKEFGPDIPEPDIPLDSWVLADWYYRIMLRNPDRIAIDLDPECPKPVCRIDLNDGVNFENWAPVREFDIVINTGTCEHIFDQRRVWQVIHDGCKVGGLMVHALPLWGWLDHGFVNYNPTFIADVAAENDYEILVWVYSELDPPMAVRVSGPDGIHALYPRIREGRSAMMHVAMRRTRDRGFQIPMQGVYSKRATPQSVRTWHEER